VGRVAEAAGRVARMAGDAGMVCTWHQHWGTLFQYPDEFFALMDATDPELLKCTPDTAHLTLGGFDVPATLRRYADRLCYVHLKDLGPNRRFADLGDGIVDLAEAAQVLRESDFSGWIVNDLDYTDNDPLDSGERNLRFLKDLLG
jgi:inosose dehydratase